jgi:hypothetical protein
MTILKILPIDILMTLSAYLDNSSFVRFLRSNTNAHIGLEKNTWFRKLQQYMNHFVIDRLHVLSFNFVPGDAVFFSCTAYRIRSPDPGSGWDDLFILYYGNDTLVNEMDTVLAFINNYQVVGRIMYDALPSIDMNLDY